MNEWRWSPLELWAGWRAFGRETLPVPLTQHDTRYATDDEYSSAVGAAAAVFAAKLDEELYGVLTVLAIPDTRIEIAGYHGPQRRRIRLHAAVRDQTGVLLVQRSGTDDTVGGAIRMVSVAASSVPQRLVAVLPQAAAGQHPPLRASNADLTPPAEADHIPRSWLDPVGRRPAPSVTQLLKRFSKRPRSFQVQVLACPGPDITEEPISALDANLLDIEGDGRYLVRRSARTGITIEPLDPGGTADFFRRMIKATTETRRRDRQSW